MKKLTKERSFQEDLERPKVLERISGIGSKSFQTDLLAIFRNNVSVDWGKYNRGSMKRRAFTKPCPFMIAKINSAVAGYLISEDIDDKAHVSYIATSPDFQKKGVGKHLMLAAIRKAKEERLTGMHLEYRGNQEHLKKFYEKNIPSLAGCMVTTMKAGHYINGDPKVSVEYELLPMSP